MVDRDDGALVRQKYRFLRDLRPPLVQREGTDVGEEEDPPRMRYVRR